MTSYLTMVMLMVSAVSVTGFGMLAQTYSNQVEYNTGNGVNSALIAVDYNYANTFVFGYAWDSKTDGSDTKLWEAVHDVSENGAMDLSYMDFGGTLGIFLMDIIYPGGTNYPYDFSLWPYWNIFSSPDGYNWVSADAGVSTVKIENDRWYSFVWTYGISDGQGNYVPERGPGQRPTPEPATLALLAIGAAIIRRK